MNCVKHKVATDVKQEYAEMQLHSFVFCIIRMQDYYALLPSVDIKQ